MSDTSDDGRGPYEESAASTASGADAPFAGRSANALAEGTLVAARYKVARFIARGGMGEVYEALDLELRQNVALKTIRAELAADRRSMERFRREIHLARRVTHPNVCRIFDLGRHKVGAGELSFLTMELLRGETLEQRLRREGRMSPDDALGIARQMAAGLAAAHEAGVVHRDFKSANVLLVGEKGKPRAVVTDFGLARGRSEDEWLSISVTGTDLVVGTAAYMAPEQAEGLEATQRSDVYSFGVVLFEMVTGDLPHAGATPMALLVNRLKAPPRSPRGLVKSLETKWEAAILRCLEIRPEDRFASPMEAIAVLDGTAPVPEIRSAGSGTFGRPEIAVRTLLVTEITGEKSLFSSSEGARATTLLDRHEALLSELRERHSGREVDRIAGTLILFPRPGDAVEFALAYHREMAALAEGTPLASRVAIHLGEAALQENSPDAVSSGAKALEVEGGARAAATRLLALASPKQTLLTRAAYDVARRALEGESTTGLDRRWMLHGAYRFEGSEEPVEIGEVGRPGDAPLSPPPDGPVARRVETSSPRRAGWIVAAAAVAALLLATVVVSRRPGPEQDATARAAVKVRRSVAVLGFKNLSGRPDATWVSTALAEMLHGELSAGEALRTIPGENVARMKLELSLADTDSLAKDTLAKIRANLGTDLVVLGSYLSLPSPDGNQLRMVVTLQDAATGETVATVNESGAEEALIRLVADAGARLRRQLGAADLSATEAGAAIASLPASPEALRLYAEGLARLHFLDAAASRDLLSKAAAVDPTHPLIHAALAEAWSALGYDKRAEDEARKAHDVSSSLSREERFSVEARFLEMTRDFGKAIETYRALFGFFPDNVDYGLRLSAAETAAGRGKEALATIEKLRSLPAPASEDVRIDLAEATAANAQSDHKRAAKVAARAAEKGKAKGARILYGRALLEGAKAAVRLGETRQSARDCEEAQRIFAEAGDRVDEAAAVNRHADAFFEDGDLVEAKRLFLAALGLYRGIGNQKGTAIALNNVADTGKEMGELAEAEKLLVEAIAHVRETGDRNREGLYVSNLADVHLLLGNLPKAKMEYDEALAVNRETGYRYALNLNLVGLGLLSLARGEPEKARPYLEECLDTCQKTGDRRLLGFALASLGDLSLAEGDVKTARARHEEALRERQKLGERRETAESRIGLARVALEEERREEAAKLASDAARDLVAQGLPDRAALANALLAQASGGTPGTRALDEARSAAQRSQSPLVRLAVALASGRVAAAAGRASEARVVLTPALEEATRLGLVTLRLELTQALATLEGGPGRARLEAVESEARRRSLGLLAAKAEKSLRK